MKKLTCVDLFAGAGGMGLGIKTAGFDVVGVLEVDDAAAKTYRQNLMDRKVWTRLGKDEGDIRNVDFGEAQKQFQSRKIKRIDLLAGGPPCQGFSSIGQAKLAHLGDTVVGEHHDRRNNLVREFCRAVEVLRPKAVLIENVPGMLDVNGVNHANLVLNELRELGYLCKISILDAAWYGVPQHRERVFIMGFASDVKPPEGDWFPEPRHIGKASITHSACQLLSRCAFDRPKEVIEWHWPTNTELPPPVSVGEAFADLPSFVSHLDKQQKYKSDRKAHPPLPYEPVENDYTRLMRSWDGLVYSTQVVDQYCRYTPRDFAIFRRMAHGDTYPDAVRIAGELFREATTSWQAESGQPYPRPEMFIPPYPLGKFADRWKKLDPSKPSWTVTAHLSKDCYSHIHPDSKQARTISIREAARLQSFPDSFDFMGNTGDSYRQIGNAVPPLLAQALATSIREHLEQSTSRKKTTRWKRIQVEGADWIQALSS